MSNVRLSWALPTPSRRQRPIASVRLDARVSPELPWTEIASVPAPGTELLLQDVAAGDWMYRAVAVDSEGQESEPAYTSAAIAFSAPGAVTGFSATVE